MEHDEFLQAIRSPFHFATCDAVLRGCKIIDISKPLQWRRLSKKVRSPLGPLCEGAPPAGGGGENCTAVRNISGYGKVLSLRPFGAPPSQREVFRHAEPPLTGEPAERSDGLRGFSRSRQSPTFPSIFKQISKFRPNFPAFCNNSETFVVIIENTPFQKTSCRKEAPL